MYLFGEAETLHNHHSDFFPEDLIPFDPAAGPKAWIASAGADLGLQISAEARQLLDWAGFDPDLYFLLHLYGHGERGKTSSSNDTAVMMMSSENTGEDIIVIGLRDPYADGGGGGGGGGGEGLTDTDASLDPGETDPAPQEPKPTPCVETAFSTPGVTLQDVNRAALAASNAIAMGNDETYEYSSIIYYSKGSVGWTMPHTDYFTDQVNWMGGLSQVPDGAVILGIVHNHPDIDGITDTIPSSADWNSYNTLLNWNRDHSAPDDLPRGITVDAKMLLWVYSNEGGKTHVYDNTDKTQKTASCTLQ